MTKKRKTTPKSKASTAMSRYIRLRDALDYCREHGVDLRQFARPEDIICKCVTCGVVKSWVRMDAGHWIGRGVGGSSGVYFDERNIHCQCKQQCNMVGGKPTEHEEFIIEKYGVDVRDELRQKHYTIIDCGSFAMTMLEKHYKDEYKELVKQTGI